MNKEAIIDIENPKDNDLISRQAVLEQIICWIGSGEYRYTNATDYLNKRIKALQAVNLQPKTGHWILTSDDDYEYCTCSECGYQNGENWMIGSQIKYCQECGARMFEPQESEG